MLIVLSDLHFAESKSFALGHLDFNNNLPPVVYKAFFREIADMIRQDHIETVHIALAGDIFEINRTPMWFKDSLRPYVNNQEVIPDSPLEARVLEILEAIAADDRVDETLRIFRTLGELFGRPVVLHYIPGNHDRLLNASPAIRMKVRELLGQEKSGEPFEHQYMHYAQGKAMVFVRHGHEYDSSNFGENLIFRSEIPTQIDPEVYDRAVLGDIMSLEVAAKLLYLFKRYYTAETILSIEQLITIYERLNEFDNVRPAQALLNFLFSTPGMTHKEVWRFIEPIFIRALDEIALNENLRGDLIKFGGMVGFAAWMLKSLFKLRPWRWGLPYWAMKTFIIPANSKTVLAPPLKYVLKEETLQDRDSTLRCIVTGHTHDARVELLDLDYNDREIYYINSGTFRNVITATPNMTEFGKLRSKSRVLIFEPGERNPDYMRETGWSFDFQAKFSFGAKPLEESPLGN